MRFAEAIKAVAIGAHAGYRARFTGTFVIQIDRNRTEAIGRAAQYDAIVVCPRARASRHACFVLIENIKAFRSAKRQHLSTGCAAMFDSYPEALRARSAI